MAWAVIVSTAPLSRPASLKDTTRLSPERAAVVAFLMKCALPAKTAEVVRPIMTNTAKKVMRMRRMVVFFLSSRQALRTCGCLPKSNKAGLL